MKEIKGYRLNIQDNTLYITKGFEKQAGIYDTEEYHIFIGLKKDNPDLKVEYMKEYKSEKSRKGIHSGLTMDVMIKGIKASENAKSIKELEEINNLYEDTKLYYGKLKKLYFDTYQNKASLATLKKKEKQKQEELKKNEYINNMNKSTNNSTANTDNETDEA